jgi:hypothetical protein
MRSDYILYVLAAVFFVITAVSLFIVEIEEGTKTLYVVSTAVVGLIFASAGFLLRPKIKATAAVQQAPVVAVPPAPQEQAPAPASSPAPQTAIVEAPIAIVPKAETAIIEAPVVVAPIVPATAEGSAVAAPKTQMMEEQVLAAQTVSPIEAPATQAPSQAGALTLIRGINANRAEQLKANGVNNVEELAKASSTDLAAKLQVSEKIVKMWIGSAKKLVK